MSVRRRSKAFAYSLSLFVLAAALWLPFTAFAQVIPGTPFGAGGSGGAGFPVSDTVFKVCDDGDATKCWQVQTSGITTATTRTLTIPNASDTIAVLGTAQSFTAVQTLNGTFLASANNSGITLGPADGTADQFTFRTAQTPDSGFAGMGTLSNNLIVAEVGDAGFDWNNGACAGIACVNPGVVIEPATTSTTQYNHMFYWGVTGRATKTLVETTATSVFQVPVTAGTGTGGTVDFTVFATDATDHQTLTGTVEFAAVNKAATETCAVPLAEGTPLNSNSSGTLTCTFACDTSPSNAVNIQFNCTSSLTQTTLEVYYRVNLVGPSIAIPQ